MKNLIGAVPTVDPLPANAARSAPSQAAPAGNPDPVTALATARLVIEQDGASGTYVDKTLDRITGEVLRQFPREEVLKMLSQAQYQAGAVIKTRA